MCLPCAHRAAQVTDQIHHMAWNSIFFFLNLITEQVFGKIKKKMATYIHTSEILYILTVPTWITPVGREQNDMEEAKKCIECEHSNEERQKGHTAKMCHTRPRYEVDKAAQVVCT